jgi:threonine dehydrogenase-like Zn-dependent dehydrogenase
MSVVAGQVGAIPGWMRATVLTGQGTEQLTVRTVPVPRPGPGQVLARVDAAGICTSVNKVIDQGADHPLMHGWDPALHPVTVGDEGAVTIVAVGQALVDTWTPGQRCAVQPAVDHAPINHLERYADGAGGVAKIAVGYSLPGLLAEYVLIPEEVLEAGCLIPLPDDTLPAGHAAIAEPISCVISAHAHHLHLSQPDPTRARAAGSGLRRGGVTVIIGAGPMGRIHVDLAMAARPRAVVVTARREERLRWIRETFGSRAAAAGVELVTVVAGNGELAAVVERVSGGRGADDLIVTAADGAVMESVQYLVARYGVLDLFAGLPAGRERVSIDERFVHYQEINITGSSGGGPWDIIETLRLMAEGEIDAAAHIGHVGDLAHAPELLRMAREGRVRGKAIVYPHRPSSGIRDVARWTGEDEQRYLTADDGERG